MEAATAAVIQKIGNDRNAGVQTCRPEKLNVMTKMATTATKLKRKKKKRANERMYLIYGAEI